MLIVMVVFASFMVILNQNLNLEQTAIKTRQMDDDSAREQLRIFPTQGNTEFFMNIDSDSVTVDCTINNTGTLPVQVVRLWVEDQSQSPMATGSALIPSTQSVIQQGQVKAYPITVNIHISDLSKTIFWFVTARGNQFNQYTNQGPAGPQGPPGTITYAVTTQGIGSITMDFKNFNYYTINDYNRERPQDKIGSDIGAPASGYRVGFATYTIFKVYVSNVDPLHQNITLYSDSLIWASAAQGGTVKGSTWTIMNVTNNKIVSYSPSEIMLPYNETPVPVAIYFGITSCKDWLNNPTTIALNILLYGKYSDNADFGQNLPFVAIKVYS